MTEAQRLALIRRVLQCAHDETETFEGEDHVGSALAYLCLAIAANDEKSHVDWRGDHRPHTLALFRLWFDDADPVWKFIKTDDCVTDDERSNGPRHA